MKKIKIFHKKLLTNAKRCDIIIKSPRESLKESERVDETCSLKIEQYEERIMTLSILVSRTNSLGDR